MGRDRNDVDQQHHQDSLSELSNPNITPARISDSASRHHAGLNPLITRIPILTITALNGGEKNVSLATPLRKRIPPRTPTPIPMRRVAGAGGGSEGRERVRRSPSSSRRRRVGSVGGGREKRRERMGRRKREGRKVLLLILGEVLYCRGNRYVVNLEALSNWEEKKMFKECMEDYNTATFPSKNIIIWMPKGFTKAFESVQTVFNDEEQRRHEMLRVREKQREQEVEALKHSMQSGLAQAMKEQQRLREEMAYQYKIGNFEAAAAIQRRLDPDAAM